MCGNIMHRLKTQTCSHWDPRHTPWGTRHNDKTWTKSILLCSLHSNFALGPCFSGSFKWLVPWVGTNRRIEAVRLIAGSTAQFDMYNFANGGACQQLLDHDTIPCFLLYKLIPLVFLESFKLSSLSFLVLETMFLCLVGWTVSETRTKRWKAGENPCTQNCSICRWTKWKSCHSCCCLDSKTQICVCWCLCVRATKLNHVATVLQQFHLAVHLN